MKEEGTCTTIKMKISLCTAVHVLKIEQSQLCLLLHTSPWCDLNSFPQVEVSLLSSGNDRGGNSRNKVLRIQEHLSSTQASVMTANIRLLIMIFIQRM